jgi:hypothetical protein
MHPFIHESTLYSLSLYLYDYILLTVTLFQIIFIPGFHLFFIPFCPLPIQLPLFILTTVSMSASNAQWIVCVCMCIDGVVTLATL